jgi:hypothetical protein
MKRTITCLLLGLAGVGLTGTSALAYNWTIENSSNWDIHQVFISSCGNRYWGQDRLGRSNIMRTGDEYILRNVDGGCYDVKLVDEDGDVCVINNVRINGNESWEVTNANLLRCQRNN